MSKMVTIVNNTIYLKVAKSSYHKEKKLKL